MEQNDFYVTDEVAGCRLDKAITLLCPDLSRNSAQQLIETGNILVNGVVSNKKYSVISGDVVSVDFPEPTNLSVEAENIPLDIVYEDENIMLVNKPQGLIVHPDDTEYRDTLIMRIQHHLYKTGEFRPEDEASFKPALVNRIDRNTGGIVIAAKTAAALRILNRMLKIREIDKFYLCVVHGKMPKKQDVLEGYLEKDEDKNIAKIKKSKSENNRSIRTKYRVIAEKSDLSLLEIELLTGRTHQIRAHLSSIGHPLLGDGKYGKLKDDKKLGFNKQALCSYKLTFDFKTDAGELEYLKGKTFKLNTVWFVDELFPNVKY